MARLGRTTNFEGCLAAISNSNRDLVCLPNSNLKYELINHRLGSTGEQIGGDFFDLASCNEAISSANLGQNLVCGLQAGEYLPFKVSDTNRLGGSSSGMSKEKCRQAIIIDNVKNGKVCSRQNGNLYRAYTIESADSTGTTSTTLENCIKRL